MLTLAHRLNEEGVKPPRGRGWAPSAIREMLQRPRYQDESAYLLVGFVRCSVCGGPVGTESRAHGSNGARQLVPHYACLDNRRRGKAICANPVALRQEILDRKILDAIAEVLQPEVLERAVEKALAKLS